MDPERFEADGIDLSIPTKLRFTNLALTEKSSLLDLNQPPGILRADKGDLLSDQ